MNNCALGHLIAMERREESGLQPAYQGRSARSWADCFRLLKLIPKEFPVFPIEYPPVRSDGRPRAAAIARALEK